MLSVIGRITSQNRFLLAVVLVRLQARLQWLRKILLLVTVPDAALRGALLAEQHNSAWVAFLLHFYAILLACFSRYSSVSGRILKQLHDDVRGACMGKSAPAKLVCEMVGGNRTSITPWVSTLSPRRGCGGDRPSKYTRIDVHYVLERVMHVERSAMCMDAQRKRHPCVRRDPDPGAAWIPRARE